MRSICFSYKVALRILSIWSFKFRLNNIILLIWASNTVSLFSFRFFLIYSSKLIYFYSFWLLTIKATAYSLAFVGFFFLLKYMSNIYGIKEGIFVRGLNEEDTILIISNNCLFACSLYNSLCNFSAFMFYSGDRLLLIWYYLILNYSLKIEKKSFNASYFSVATKLEI